MSELERIKERQAASLSEIKKLSEWIVEMEKLAASLELKLNTMTSKYKREKRAHAETEYSRSGNRSKWQAPMWSRPSSSISFLEKDQARENCQIDL